MHLKFMCLITVLYPLSAADQDTEHYRFEYKYSFKGPHLTQPDLTVPFWKLLGDTVAGDEQIRLVPSIRDKKGLIWSNYPFPHEDWEIEVHVRIEGRGKIGADGLAIWYTSTPGEVGPVFGSKDYWRGIGVFLDSFDNDNRMDNPMISVVANDGTKQYQHGSDGSEQYSGSCRMDFRNRPYPVRIKVKYFQRTLTVSYSAGNLENDDFEICTSIENFEIPANYSFGVSAATGGLADDHDVLKFLTWSITDKPFEDDALAEEERKRLQDDYEKNLDDYNKMQEEYRQQHPDASQDQRHPEQLYEGAASQELRSIFEIQSSIKKDIRSLSDLIGMMLEQQNNVFSKLERLGELSGTVGEARPPAGADDSAKKYHIDNVLNMQRETYDAVKGIRDNLARVEQSVSTIDYRVQQQGENNVGGGNVNSYDDVQQRQALTEKLHSLQNDVTVLLQRQASQPTKPTLICPEPDMPSCVSLGVFVAIAAAQVIILLIYHSMRASREDAAKKFF